MPGTPAPDSHGRPEDGRPYALLILLPLFGLIALMALSMELAARPKPYLSHAGGKASVPHGPAEFPEILETDPLEGLADAGPGEYAIPALPLDEETWPCSSCHADQPPDPNRRELGFHEDIVLAHDQENRWCLDCHDAEDRDRLRLASGRTIPFEESYRLCGQCHGTTYRDWRAGIHGKRTGYWNGPKRYLLCIHCHSPHSPRFRPLKPLPPPVRPEFYRPGSPRP